MKIIQATCERNFHVSNDDRFLLEKLGLTATIEEDEDVQSCINELRDTMIDNFKSAYPRLDTSINFSYNLVAFDKQEDNRQQQKVEWNNPNTKDQFIYRNSKEEEHYNYHSPSIEQVKAEILSYKFGAKALKSIYYEQVKDNPELLEVYNQKIEQLQNTTV